MKSCNFLFYKLVHLFIATSTMQYLFTQIRTVVQKLSLRFNGHFPGEPASAGVYWSKGWWRWWWQLDYWSHKSCNQMITTNKPTFSFSQAWCPSCRPTNSVKALKEKYHIPWTCLPQAHMGVFQLCLTTNSSWLPWGRVAMPLISQLMPVYNSIFLCPILTNLTGTCRDTETNSKQISDHNIKLHNNNRKLTDHI